MSLSNDTNMVMPVMPTYGMGMGMGYGMGTGGMWGNDWFAWIIILLLFGNRGWGNNSCDSGSSVLPYLLSANNNNSGCGCCAPATCQELQAGFNNQSVQNKLNGLENGLASLGYDNLAQINTVNQGICQLGYQTQNAINGLGAQLANCCCDIERSIDHANFQTAQGINNIGTQLASCCCETQRQIERGFCDTNYNLATNTTAIIQNAHNDTDRVIAKLDAMEMARKDETISELRSQVNALNLAQSQANQNNVFGARVDAAVAEILRRTGHDCPTAAYVVQPPTPVNFPNWCNNGCGCNNCGC